MEAEFRKAADEVQRLSKKPNNSDLLTLYGLYKQATEGDCNTSLSHIRSLTTDSLHRTLTAWNAQQRSRA